MKTIEYKIRPVTRYIVTKYTEEEHEDGRCSGGSEMCGEFDREEEALRAGFAMAKMDFHERSLNAEVKFPDFPDGWSYYRHDQTEANVEAQVLPTKEGA